MAADKRVLTRMKKELERLERDPPYGVTCWYKEGKLNHLEANLLGAEGTPYQGGVFKLDIKIPNNYPFQPPNVQFLTKIYHPNIDTAGRICLDVLKSPPTGSWKPAHNLHTILTSVQLLLAEPNPDDGLMVDISSEYKHRRATFIVKAKEWTHRYAKSAATGEEVTGSRSTHTEDTPNTAIPHGLEVASESTGEEVTGSKSTHTEDGTPNTAIPHGFEVASESTKVLKEGSRKCTAAIMKLKGLESVRSLTRQAEESRGRDWMKRTVLLEPARLRIQ